MQPLQHPRDHDALGHHQNAAEHGCIEHVEKQLLRHTLLDHDLLGHRSQNAVQTDANPVVQVFVRLREHQTGDENQQLQGQHNLQHLNCVLAVDDELCVQHGESLFGLRVFVGGVLLVDLPHGKLRHLEIVAEHDCLFLLHDFNLIRVERQRSDVQSDLLGIKWHFGQVKFTHQGGSEYFSIDDGAIIEVVDPDVVRSAGFSGVPKPHGRVPKFGLLQDQICRVIIGQLLLAQLRVEF
mmetsp:Transcript_622/g.1262  ORF Transcript_622/g.1262 Transcript_622/m.1262 type:complete len:238 (+) Transcript_622:420-1133(+)